MVRLSRVCLVLILTQALVACSSAVTDDIVFAVATAPKILDPRLASDAASERVNALLYDHLVRLDDAGKPQPGMADWEQLDPQRYRITLRPTRASFWEGGQPTAKDVAATYLSVLDKRLGSPHTGALAHIERIEVHDSDTLDFVLSRPDPFFASRLTLGITPADAVALNELAVRPRGSGEFKLIERRDDNGLILERRHDGQRLVFEPVSDPTMRTLKLLRGEAHLLQNDLPAELYGYLDRQPELVLSASPGTTFTYIGFNLADPVLADRNVRLAIAHAIDRDAIIRHLFGGYAQKAESVLRPEHWAGVADLTPHVYDPALARSYLSKVGYGPERPLELSYKTSTDPLRLRIAHVFQSQLAEIGIWLNIASYDWGTYFGDIKAGRFQIYSLSWVGVNTPDILRYAFHSASSPPGGANRGAYRSSHVDVLLDRAERQPPFEARIDYIDAQRQIHHDLVYVPLWYESNVVASRGVSGYSPGHDGNYLALAGTDMGHETR